MAGTGDYRSDISGCGMFVMGLLAGAAVGAALGVLFAPKAGSELRNEISDKAGELKNQAQEGYRKAAANAGEWAEKGKDAYERAREAAARGVEEAERYAKS